MTAERRRDFAWIGVAYATALVAAALTVALLPDVEPLWQAAWADVAATLVIFAFSRIFDNSSFYDAYWSVAPPVLIAFWWWTYGGLDLRVVIIAVLVLLWGVRLTHNWARGWHGLNHVDWRYVDLKAKTGVFYPLVDLFGIQMLPTALVFVGCVPLWMMLAEPSRALGWLDVLWIVIGFGALWLEFRADNVLRAFRLDPASNGGVLRHDVWAWCRHPNYLGELGFWLALGLAGYAASGQPLSGLGFVLMLGLFLVVSIPMIDKRQLANKPDYEAYRREVPALIPWKPLRGGDET